MSQARYKHLRGKIEHVGKVEENDPRYGTSLDVTNKNSEIYRIGDLDVEFKCSRSYDALLDYDAEYCVRMGHAEFCLGVDDHGGSTSSRLFMDARGDMNCLGTTFEKGKARGAWMEEGSARPMLREWEALVGRSGLSVEDFNECLLLPFTPYWFGGARFLPLLAQREQEESDAEKESSGSEEEESDTSSEEEVSSNGDDSEWMSDGS